MRIIFVIVCTSVLAFALSACSPTGALDIEPSATATATASSSRETQSPAAEATCSGTPIDVYITYSLQSDPSGGVTIDATSNLPDGSELNADFLINNAFLAQDEGVLNDGHISFGPFSDRGTPLHGSYEMAITLPIARNQPESVQTCIGDAGQNLVGALVSTDEISGDKFATLETIVIID